MPTNRIPKGRQPRGGRITPEALAAYRHARELFDHADIENWEAQGGRQREYFDACVHLQAALGRQPWQAEVIDTIDCPEPPDWLTDEEKRRDWREARSLLVELRRELSVGR